MILRMTGGVIIIAHGLPKWPRRALVAQNWAKGGMPLPHLAVGIAYLIEVPGGAMYAMGLLTGWISVLLVVFMLAVTWWSIRVTRERMVSHGSKGYDLNLALLAIFLATAFTGGGAMALDSVLGISPYWPAR